MNNITHKIYITDINFPEKASSKDEKQLREKSQIYNDIFNKRFEINNRRWEKSYSKDFIGLVDYLPVNKDIDISKASDILVYLYDNKTILYNDYYKSMELIITFINKNKLTNIQLCGDDVDRLIINGIDIISDIKNNVNHKINIQTTKKKSIANHKYTLAQ